MTRRAFGKLLRSQFSDPATKEELLSEARQALRRKRRIKDSTDTAPVDPLAQPVWNSPESIPIVVDTDANFVHYPLNELDIRSLLQALPRAATDGLSRIQLLLGDEYIEKRSDLSSEERAESRDPFTGRLGVELLPGVYVGKVLGTYAPWSANIALHAYVYSAESVRKLPLSESALMGYLRLHAMKTLIHECAHHHDNCVRVGRGRWLADQSDPAENYAERMEYEWTMEIGMEWLSVRYPQEMRSLTDWLEEFGGCRVPLFFFAGDPRVTGRDGLHKYQYASDSAFESFVEDVTKLPEPSPSHETWLLFAWELHYMDDYEKCMRLLDRILSCEPSPIDAQVCRADTLVHLERYDEAFDLTGTLLESEPGNSEIWKIRADVLVERHAWSELLALCDLWEKATEGSKHRRQPLFRAIAYCGLEQLAEMEHWIAVYVGDGPQRRAEYLRRTAFRRAGKAAVT
ncbi:MAG: hypothetical protein WCO60_19185 [Verrucomicrobiota bacterium]